MWFDVYNPSILQNVVATNSKWPWLNWLKEKGRKLVISQTDDPRFVNWVVQWHYGTKVIFIWLFCHSQHVWLSQASTLCAHKWPQPRDSIHIGKYTKSLPCSSNLRSDANSFPKPPLLSRSPSNLNQKWGRTHPKQTTC